MLRLEGDTAERQTDQQRDTARCMIQRKLEYRGPCLRGQSGNREQVKTTGRLVGVEVSRGHSLVVESRLLTAVATLASEHRL